MSTVENGLHQLIFDDANIVKTLFQYNEPPYPEYDSGAIDSRVKERFRYKLGLKPRFENSIFDIETTRRFNDPNLAKILHGYFDPKSINLYIQSSNKLVVYDKAEYNIELDTTSKMVSNEKFVFVTEHKAIGIYSGKTKVNEIKIASHVRDMAANDTVLVLITLDVNDDQCIEVYDIATLTLLNKIKLGFKLVIFNLSITSDVVIIKNYEGYRGDNEIKATNTNTLELIYTTSVKMSLAVFRLYPCRFIGIQPTDLMRNPHLKDSVCVGNNLLFIGYNYGVVSIRDIATKKIIALIKIGVDAIDSVVYCDNKLYVISNDKLNVVDLLSNTIIQTIDIKHRDMPTRYSNLVVYNNFLYIGFDTYHGNLIKIYDINSTSVMLVSTLAIPIKIFGLAVVP